MININETSENSKIYIQRNITNAELVKNNYVTEDELTNTLKKYTTIEDLSRALAQTRIPFVIITSLPNGSAYVVNGDLNNVILAANQHYPYLAYFHNTSGRVYGQIGIHKLTFCSLRTDRNGIISYYDFSMNGGEVYVEINYLYDVNSHNYVLGKINANRKSYLTSIPEEYVTDSELTKKGYATEQWVEDKGYLKEIPSEYITETELNEVLANIDSGNNIVSSTIFLEVIGDFGNKKILSDKVGYEEHNREIYSRLYDVVNEENPSFSDETFFVNAEFDMNGLENRVNGILSHTSDIIFSTFSTFMSSNINYSLWIDVGVFLEKYIDNEPMEFVIDVAHIDYHNIATTTYVDEQLGNVNNILENIIE